VAENVVLGLRMPEALKDERMPEYLKRPLEEWWEWYDIRYAMPVEIDIEPGVIKITIFYDTEEELKKCEEACVKEAEKELKSEDVEWEEVWHGCHEGCVEDIAYNVYIDINRAASMLDKVLKKYGIKARSEGGWEGLEYWIRYSIEQ